MTDKKLMYNCPHCNESINIGAESRRLMMHIKLLKKSLEEKDRLLKEVKEIIESIAKGYIKGSNYFNEKYTEQANKWLSEFREVCGE